jgi:hypothetical protein
MNTTLSRSSAIAATRALAKARLGDREALRYLVERRAEGDVAARRALEDYNKHAISQQDAAIVRPN